MLKKVYPDLNDNALKVLEKRNYLWPLEGRRETVDEMFGRTARFVASAEYKFKLVPKPKYTAEEFEALAFDLMRSLRFIPNTPTLTNAGRPGGQLAACYVLPIEDSMSGIMDTLKAQALVQKSGGGTGFSFGCIRERGSKIKSTGQGAVGPIPIIKLMNYLMSNFIIQGGMRHGANMGVLPCDHQDIEEFIGFKEQDGSCASFNISVGATDAFMKAVIDGTHVELLSRAGGPTKSIPARDLFDSIAKLAWRTGDPGMLFLDTIERFNPTPHLGKLEATNPCGEQALLPNEACTLGHFNLARYVVDGRFDFESFESDIELGVRFLDNVIEVNSYALPEIELMHRGTNRKIGLGVMGFADALIMMDIAYGSNESFKIADAIAKALRRCADLASEALGKERGNFGGFIGSEVSKIWDYMRNACRTTVAPTGTTGMIAGVSTGIEPVFAYGLRREQAGMIMYEWHPLFEAWLETKGSDIQASINSYYDQKGSLVGCPHISSHEERLFVQANDVKYRDHIEMQATWQRSIDNAISKTINLPTGASVADIKDAYLLAWESGCKGITVYRDGCRQNQALSINKGSTQLPEGFGQLGGSWTVPAGTQTATNGTVSFANSNGLGVVGTIHTSNQHTGKVLSYRGTPPARDPHLPINIPNAMVGTAYGTITTVDDSGTIVTNYQPVVDPDKLCPECDTESIEMTGGCSTCKGCGYSVCSI
jgi:ribonucleoside-diphosphate reductase alpha chain